MIEERVIDGVLHVLEGKTYRPLTAEELTQRLLEARRAVDVRPDPQPWIAPAIPGPHWGPLWRPYVGDVIPNPYEITSTSRSALRSPTE